MSTTPLRKPGVSRSAMIESLEPRQLLSGYVLDTSFGNGGVVRVLDSNPISPIASVGATSIRADGSIILSDGKHLLNPDGTLGPITSPLAPVAVPTPPQPTNKQADGKYLTVVDSRSQDGTESAQLTRYNKNGTKDATFGKNGSITDFSFVGASTYTPNQVIVVGTRIYLVGLVTDQIPDSEGSELYTPTLVALKENGSLDPAFKAANFGGEAHFIGGEFAGLGADGTIYLTYGGQDSNTDDFNGYAAISPSGQVLSGDSVTELGDHCLVDGPVYSPKGLAVFLVGAYFSHPSDPPVLDGPYGSVDVYDAYPDQYSDFVGGSALTADDGRIIVNFAEEDGTNSIMCYRPDVGHTTSVSGHFFSDANANGKLDKTETGLASWQAYADINNNGVFDLGEPTAYADVLGNYTIPNLTPGTYHIREVRKAGWNRTSPAGDWPTGGVYTVTVAANKSVTNLNFGNSDTKHGVGTISGTIFNDVNGNEIQDTGEPGLAGWQVYADFNNNGVYDAGEAITTTGKNGNYKFVNLVQGGYRIREVRQSGWVRTSPRGDWPLGYYDSDIVTGQNVTGDNFGNAKGNSILAGVAGTIFNDLNGNGKLDPGEKPAAGIVVELISEPFENVAQRITTGANGAYSFTALDPATYWYLNVYTNGPIPVNVREQIDAYDLPLRPSQVIQDNCFIQPMARFGVAIYNDVNGNAHIDPGDGPGFNGQIYVDLNNNGQLDRGEPTIGTSDFESTSNWLPAGTYYLRLTPQAGWVQTYPSNNSPMVITLVAGQTLHGLIFTVHQTI